MRNSSAPNSVLVLDEDPAVLVFVGRLLDHHGIRTLFARSAEEAATIAARNYVPIDLILCNITLRNLSGPEVVNRVREIRPGLPVMYMAAQTDQGVIRIDLMHREPGEIADDRATFLNTIQSALSSRRVRTAGG